MISQKDKRIQEQDLEVQTHKKEVTSLQKQLKDVTLKHSINDMKVEKLEEDIVDYQQRLEKEKATNKTLIAQVDEIQQKLEEETKEKQKYHRELMSHQDREKYYSDTNIGLKDNLEGLSEQHEKLTAEHNALVAKHQEFEKVHKELLKKYKNTNSVLEKINKERQRLFEDTARNERIIVQNEIDIEALQKALDHEKNNYDKIKMRFSEIEILYENTEITKQKEIRKVEIEKETVEEILTEKKLALQESERQRQDWIRRHEEEHKSNLSLMSQYNNLRIQFEDAKAAKEKLASDIKQLDKSYKKTIEISKEKEIVHNETIRENEKLRIQLAGAQDAFKNLEVHHKDYIIKLKKEHLRTLNSIDNIYNNNGMEYEDLYTKMHVLFQEHNEDLVAIKKLNSLLHLQRDKTRKAEDEVTLLMDKFDV